jgi:hypothetical protein
MDQIGASHITNIDFLIWFVTLALVLSLERLPSKSVRSQVLAILCGCLLLSIIPLLIFGDLGEGGVFELVWVAFVLCGGLWRWNDRRSRAKVADHTSQVSFTN